MKKNRKSIYNFLISIIAAFVLAQIVMFEGYAILYSKQQKNGIPEMDIVINDIGTYKILATIVFFIVIAVFNTKRFRKINLNKLSIYLILVVIVSILISLESMLLLSSTIVKFYPDFLEYLMNDYFIASNAIIIYIFIAPSLFLITFILLVNRKVKYIKFLTKEVKVIENEGFGKTIEVKGGDELSELCKSINSMSVELGKKIENEKIIENNKNELITNISHDLKTPLTSIVGYLELLNTKDLKSETRDEYIKIAYNKSLRLNSLFNELFEYTKLTGNNITLEKDSVNISMLLNQAVGESIVGFTNKNINVVLDNPYEKAFCNINAIQMLRVFENLIRNAEKYADSNSVFKVSLNIIDRKIIISFMNKCKDINSDDLKQLFEKFYRVDKSRSKEGSGLGLAIVKRIVELHDGNITAEKINDNIKFNIILNEA